MCVLWPVRFWMFWFSQLCEEATCLCQSSTKLAVNPHQRSLKLVHPSLPTATSLFRIFHSYWDLEKILYKYLCINVLLVIPVQNIELLSPIARSWPPSILIIMLQTKLLHEKNKRGKVYLLFVRSLLLSLDRILVVPIVDAAWHRTL